MTLKQTRLVTNDVAKLTEFYESVSGSKGDIIAAGFVQFQSPAAQGLAIIEQGLTRAYGDDIAEAGANRSVILDFEVADADAEYARLQGSVSDWVMPPKVMPWARAPSYFAIPTAIWSTCTRSRDTAAGSLGRICRGRHAGRGPTQIS